LSRLIVVKRLSSLGEGGAHFYARSVSVPAHDTIRKRSSALFVAALTIAR
jgi:hypothetical protein